MTNFESFWKDCIHRGCDKCPAKVPCWAAPGDEDCRENCLAWAQEENYDDDTHKCDHCPIYDWCRLNGHLDDDSSCLDVFREWANAEVKED